jgi:type IV secretion system protein VirB9
MMRTLVLTAAALLPLAASADASAQRRSRPAITAHRYALREPTARAIVHAVQVYPWNEGAVYRVDGAPERVTDIALQAGETLVSVAAGDTARWTIGDTSSGAGAGKRTHVLVKPFAAGLRTNVVIATDRRVYHLALESRADGAMTALSWTYPQDELLALTRKVAEEKAATPVAVDLRLDALYFGYRITGSTPPWRPLRAFDDGRQTFIEFPASVTSGEAPPLFVVDQRGGVELVNYRLRGRYYVVDRLFDAAELRLGKAPQQVVRIKRDPEDRAERGGRRER